VMSVVPTCLNTLGEGGLTTAVPIDGLWMNASSDKGCGHPTDRSRIQDTRRSSGMPQRRGSAQQVSSAGQPSRSAQRVSVAPRQPRGVPGQHGHR
jgi:hypothetical protein